MTPTGLALVGVICAIAGAGLFVYHRGMMTRFRRRFADDPDVDVDEGLSKRLRTKPPHRAAVIWEPQGDEYTWVVESRSAFASCSTLSLSRHSWRAVLATWGTMPVVELGDAELDKRLRLQGSNADALREIFTQPDVQRAVHAAFNDQRLEHLEIRDDGSARCQVEQRDGSADEMKDTLLSMIQLLALLEHAAAHAQGSKVPAGVS